MTREKIKQEYNMLRLLSEDADLYGVIAIQGLRTYVELRVDDKKDVVFSLIIKKQDKKQTKVMESIFNLYNDGVLRCSINAWHELVEDTNTKYYATVKMSNGVDEEYSTTIPVEINFDKVYCSMTNQRTAEFEQLRNDVQTIKMLVDSISANRVFKLTTDGLKKGMIPTVIDDDGHVVYTYPLGTYIGSVNGIAPIGKDVHLEAKDIPFNDNNVEVLLNHLIERDAKMQESVVSLTEAVNNINSRLAEMELTLVAFKNNQ